MDIEIGMLLFHFVNGNCKISLLCSLQLMNCSWVNSHKKKYSINNSNLVKLTEQATPDNRYAEMNSNCVLHSYFALSRVIAPRRTDNSKLNAIIFERPRGKDGFLALFLFCNSLLPKLIAMKSTVVRKTLWITLCHRTLFLASVNFITNLWVTRLIFPICIPNTETIEKETIESF